MALCLGLLANVAGQSFLFVVLPPLGRRLGFSDVQSGAILSVSALLLIVSAPVWGYLSERIGRKPVLLTALGGAALALAAFSAIVAWRIDGAMTAAVALGLFFSVRSLQMLVSSGLQPAAQAYVADITVPGRRAHGMGMIGAAYGLGIIVGAALAWRLGGRHPVLAFALLATLIGMAFAAVLLFVREPRSRRATIAAADRRLVLAGIWPFLAITLVAISAYSIVQQVMALRLQDALGFSPEEAIGKAGAALMCAALAMIIVQGVVLRLFSWHPERLLGTGGILSALSMLLCSLAGSYAEIFAVIVLFGVALGFMFPGNLASLSLRAGVHAQGKAAGVNMIAQGSGLVIGPLAGASLHQLSPQAPFVVAAILLTLASGFALFAWRSRGRRAERPMKTAGTNG